MAQPTVDSCLIVGAGLAGLAAANRLRQGGLSVTVCERAPRVGGRMGTCRVGQDDVDSGVQFFTGRDERFLALIEGWVEKGWARRWSFGFPSSTGARLNDGHPRFKGTPSIHAIARGMAEGLDVRCGAEAVRIAENGGRWELTLADGQTLLGAAAIVAIPAPDALKLLEDSGIALDEEAAKTLRSIQYEPCIEVHAILDGPSRVPDPGAVLLPGGSAVWVADNRVKGVSKESIVTVQAGPDFSRQYWETEDSIVAGALLQEVEGWVGARAASWVVQRWPHSLPKTIHTESTLEILHRPALFLAGDGFGGPRLEGAAVSGLEAARRVLIAAGKKSRKGD